MDDNQKPASSRSDRLKFIIFSAIGVFNTLFDLVLYILILDASHNIVIANLAATSAALVGSYFLNSKLTFKSKKWTLSSFAGFVGVTVFGLWVLQTSIIYGLNHVLTIVPEHIWRLAGGLEKTAKQVVPKLLATAVTFIWNYLWYNKVIFKDDNLSRQAEIELSEL